ncbi:MAG TPA: allantoicase [Myxococcales bacterium]|nr:allantoicase [Myxococcales bacterium]
MSDFTDLVDLASERLGSAVVLANDEFFAPKENLLKPHPAEWREHDYTDRGKWMDGWETRRRREPGYDWCIVRLGLPGVVRGVIVDTAFFRGNYPAECSIEACAISESLDLDAVGSAAWVEILPRSALKGDTRNAFPVADGRRFTHLRLNIFPDGGVARLRVHGEVMPDQARLTRLGGAIDLAALENGGRSLVCSDMFFGGRNNLLLAGRPENMSSGWETRRRRGPGHDWNIVRLGAPGMPRRVEVDTTHFKGNAPGQCSIDACDAPGASADALVGDAAQWRVLLPKTRTQPNTRHFFEEELRAVGRITHVRLNLFPDGGVARLRVWGEPEAPPAPSVQRLNAFPRDQAVATLRTLCGSLRFAERMTDARPFEDAPALRRIAERTFWSLGEQDWLEAFSAHPRIGEKTTELWAEQEQSGVQGAAAGALAQLARLNGEYFEKHGFVFLICAAGRSAEEMLASLKERLAEPRAREIRTAAEEQAKILRLRIDKWLGGA